MTTQIAGSTRRLDLDRAKGFAILLVVVGHIVAREPPSDNEWYVMLQKVIYQFHMPFFMYLSGYVTFLSGAASCRPRAWPDLAKKRAARLLVPFFLFGTAIVVGKLIAARVIYVDNLPASIPEAMTGLLWYTDLSPATSVWYIAVLFVFCVITPPLIWLDSGRLRILLWIAGVLYLLPMPHIIYGNRIADYFIFFALGLVAAKRNDEWVGYLDRISSPAAGALVVVLLAMLFWERALPDSAWLLICGVLSMPAVHGLVRRAPLMNSDVLVRLGALSFVIYLLNTPFIGLAKGLLMEFMSWDGPNFLLFAPILTIAGIFGPILIKRFLLGRFPLLDRMTN